MNLKSISEINELVHYLRDNGLITDDKARAWLDKYVPNWRERHDTKIVYADRIGED